MERGRHELITALCAWLRRLLRTWIENRGRIGQRWILAFEDFGMTTVQIPLPDQLALEAERAGLLSSELLEEWLRKQLKARAAEELFAAMDKMSAVDDPSYMSPKEVAEEIRAVRAERLVCEIGRVEE